MSKEFFKHQEGSGNPGNEAPEPGTEAGTAGESTPGAGNSSAGGEGEKKVCPVCGAGVEASAKFCTNCSAPLVDLGEAAGEGPVLGLKPWAVKAGRWVSNLSRGVKLGIPLAILFIVGLIVALVVVASGHSPSATVSRYLSEIQRGDFERAYSMVSRPGGRFSSFEYFERWQGLTVEELGPLEDYRVKPRNLESSLFGHFLADDPADGEAFVATMIYRDKSFDVNIIVEGAGGHWPLNRYRLTLSEEPTRVLCSPLGASIFIDGQMVGEAEEDKEFKEAMSLGNLPKDMDSAVDYTKKVIQTIRNGIDEVKRIARELDKVVESVQRAFDKISTPGTAWSEIADAFDRVTTQSRELGIDLARATMQVYWLFGGGDDGSLRARLTRTQTGLDIENLPEGYHEVKAEMPGLKTTSKFFIAPDDVEARLDPTLATSREIKGTMGDYYSEKTYALANTDPAGLDRYTSGDLLDEEYMEVESLKMKGVRRVANLTELKYGKIKFLSGTVATIEATEGWSYQDYRGNVPASPPKSSRHKYIYTLKRSDGRWKALERKAD